MIQHEDIAQHNGAEQPMHELPPALSCPLPLDTYLNAPKVPVKETFFSRPGHRPAAEVGGGNERITGPDIPLIFSITDARIVKDIKLQTGAASEQTARYQQMLEDGVPLEHLDTYYHENLKETGWQNFFRFIGLDKTQPTITDVDLKASPPSKIAFSKTHLFSLDNDGLVRIIGLDDNGNIQDVTLDLNLSVFPSKHTFHIVNDTLIASNGDRQLFRLSLNNFNKDSQIQLFTLFATLVHSTDRPTAFLAPENVQNNAADMTVEQLQTKAESLHLQIPVAVLSHHVDESIVTPIHADVLLPSGTPFTILSVFSRDGVMMVEGSFVVMDVPPVINGTPTLIDQLSKIPTFQQLSSYRFFVRLQDLVLDPTIYNNKYKSPDPIPTGPSGMDPTAESIVHNVPDKYTGPKPHSRVLATWHHRQAKMQINDRM